MDRPQRDQLAAFLEEDLGRGDITSESLVAADTEATGLVHSREPAVIAGIEEAVVLAETMQLEALIQARDGDNIEAGAVVLELRGKARAILGLERTLLNIVGHMSGVATLTRRAVDAVTSAHSGALSARPPRIAATRKTLPGLRRLQKKAVVIGGGLPHRHDLSAAVLVKDNHLSLNPDLVDVVRRTREHVGDVPIEIEVESLDDALVATRSGADTLLLDNLEPAEIAAIVDALGVAGLRKAVSLEASGGITLDTIPGYADTGVDVISMGMLTTSAPHIDYSLHFKV